MSYTSVRELLGPPDQSASTSYPDMDLVDLTSDNAGDGVASVETNGSWPWKMRYAY
jgi:hypothetical protein